MSGSSQGRVGTEWRSGSRRSPTFLTVLVLALCGIAGLAPAGAQALVFGSQDDIGSSASPKRIEQTLRIAQRTGAKILRVEANWAALEPNAQGQRDPVAVAALDRIVDRVTKHGMRTLLFIDRTPCWASAAPADVRGTCAGPDASRFAVSRFRPVDPTSVVPVATFLAARYAKRLAAFQIWNEPDQANEKYWAGTDKVRSYVAMTRALYRPLKRAAPKVPVLAGSFVGTNGKWLEAMYASGVKGSYDGLAVQFYSQPLYGIRNIRAIQTVHRDKKPIWLTEFGYTSCLRAGGPATQIDQKCVTRAGQARAISDVLAALRRRPWVAAAIQYDVIDDGAQGYTFGVADAQGRLKPVYKALRRVLTGRTRAPKGPTVRLRRRGAGVRATGTASLTDLVKVTVHVNGVLRYRATLLADQRGVWRLDLPPSVGTRGLTVKVIAGWTGRTTSRI